MNRLRILRKNRRLTIKEVAYTVGIAVFANVVTIILGIFYFFDFFLFKLWIAELVTTLVIAGIKVHVTYMIFESELED